MNNKGNFVRRRKVNTSCIYPPTHAHILDSPLPPAVFLLRRGMLLLFLLLLRFSLNWGILVPLLLTIVEILFTHKHKHQPCRAVSFLREESVRQRQRQRESTHKEKSTPHAFGGNYWRHLHVFSLLFYWFYYIRVLCVLEFRLDCSTGGFWECCRVFFFCSVFFFLFVVNEVLLLCFKFLTV